MPKTKQPKAQAYEGQILIRMLIADAVAAEKLGNLEFAAERLRDAAAKLQHCADRVTVTPE